MDDKINFNPFEALPPEGQELVDRCGYEFLASHGYNVTGCEKSGKKRRKLKAALRADKMQFFYNVIEEEGAVVLFFALKDNEGNLIGKSKGLRFKVFDGEKSS